MFIILILFFIGILLIVPHLFIVIKDKERYGQKIYLNKEFSVIIPCYNEDMVINETINSFISKNYETTEVIFVNDGSTDHTLEILNKTLNLKIMDKQEDGVPTKAINAVYQSRDHENIYVIDKVNGGKADSLNAGINFATRSYVVTLDADTILKDDALYEMNKSLQDDDVIAVGGNVVVLQGVKTFTNDNIVCEKKISLLESVQFLEYLRGFFLFKNSYAKFKSLFVISGAFGVFRKDVMLDIGGFRNTIGEDIDITIRFNKYALENKKRILYNDKAICFTEVPNKLIDFFKQRVRWQKGYIDAVKYHFKFLLKNFLKCGLGFFMLIESGIFTCLSIGLTIYGVLFIGDNIFEKKPISIFIIMLTLCGLGIFFIYNLFVFFIISKSVLKIKTFGILKLFIVLIFEFLVYRMFLIFIILYGSIEFWFKPSGWNKVKRIGVAGKKEL